ncbi:MucR family transcriptional regulator [Pseudodesulfovibrio thermohalotolerans]|uniref:MucR family transcriptional regulator n=1 Tax=Pseudodesulfovibrio thermohalotolerans TaxID=2880651 RepID=UPI0022B9E407|nr:MucR family transcriptional regulator [Pseudodesulfovibrio thermohalotolerans]WFS63410.1 MucR family transcriptional regulator [Pseudodesulfovibrio thermohalotolerans]
MSHMENALKIVEAQAGVRPMTVDEACEMVKSLSDGLQKIADGDAEPPKQEPPCDPKRAIRNKSIVCLECGRTFKTLSKKHLESHGLTPDEYRAKWGYKKRAPLSCRETAKARSERMKEMKLWTRTGKKPEDKEKPAKGKAKDAPKDA